MSARTSCALPGRPQTRAAQGSGSKTGPVGDPEMRSGSACDSPGWSMTFHPRAANSAVVAPWRLHREGRQRCTTARSRRLSSSAGRTPASNPPTVSTGSSSTSPATPALSPDRASRQAAACATTAPPAEWPTIVQIAGAPTPTPRACGRPTSTARAIVRLAAVSHVASCIERRGRHQAMSGRTTAMPSPASSCASPARAEDRRAKPCCTHAQPRASPIGTVQVVRTRPPTGTSRSSTRSAARLLVGTPPASPTGTPGCGGIAHTEE